MKKYIKVFCILVATMLLFEMQCYAGIDFEVEKVVWDSKAVYDIKEGVIYSQGYALDWSKLDDIPTIEDMPEPNVQYLYDSYGGNYGYIIQIDGEYYLEGKFGDRGTPLPLFPLGAHIPEDIEQCYIDNKEYNIDLFPYNSRNVKINYEVSIFNDKTYGLQHAYGTVGKWFFGWDREGKKTYILADGISAIETNLYFKVLTKPVSMNQNDYEIIVWEDDTKFYIRNYNILISTDKESFYDAMEELEAAPKVKYRDTYLAFEQAPIVQDDRTLIPARFLFEQMGATVEWEKETQTVTIMQDNTAISLAIGDTEAQVNGQPVTMDIPAQLINGKTMVPVRFLSEELGYTVDWDGENRIITIK